jgi:hypothetical protein
MTSVTSDISNGRFCNQLIRSIATSLIAEIHNLKVSYDIHGELNSLGLNLFVGENTWPLTVRLTDSNYFETYRLEKIESNLDPNNSFFQTREIIEKVYEIIQIRKESIIGKNQFKDRYENNNDCFIHIRLDDAAQWNPGFEYYEKVIGNLNYDTLYISTDQPSHPLICQLLTKYYASLIQYNEVDTIKFASTCKYVVLSHGTFSACIGYFSFFSQVYYSEFKNLVRWHGDIFSIAGWNKICYTSLTKKDIITSDKYLEAFPENYYKTDVIIHGHSMWWRNRVLNPPPKNSNLIISGHSDYGITDKEVGYFNPRVWYTINKQSDRIFGLPLGITNNTNESGLHPIYGNLESMIEIMNESKQDKNLVYMNFNIATYPQERQEVFNLFQDKEWVTRGIIENTIQGRARFLREIRNHTFALCPRGNGVDTHRLWETLYMGSIPIVKKDIAYSDFEDLPICFINEWNEVNIEFLKQEKQRITSTEWNMDKLKVSYWINKVALTLKV